MNGSRLRIGTRGSRLALWQADFVANSLDAPSEIKVIRTSGDRIRTASLQRRRTMGFFTREIEIRLLNGEIDLAVHSLKDLPTASPEGLVIAACLPRASVSDVLLIHPAWHLPKSSTGFPLRAGCKVGAGSLRRQALLHIFAPDVRPALIRGNVPTRVKKCLDGEYGAVIMARAGLDRLKLVPDGLWIYELPPQIWLPSPAQGIIAIQSRQPVPGIVSRLNDAHAHTAAMIERGLMERFEGGCHAAFGAWARPASGYETWIADIGMDASVSGVTGVSGWLRKQLIGSPETCLQCKPGDTFRPPPDPDVMKTTIRLLREPFA